ncbi:multiheme c-type cytochrome [Desulfovulcanus sp.]
MRVKMKLFMAILFAFSLMAATIVFASEGSYVGSAKCGECHEKEYNKFKTYSKKSKSWHSIEIMASDLTPEEIESCYRCHTTGYGETDGFVNIEQTPHLADVGCETCHGPGKAHVDTDGNPEQIIRKPSEADCTKCHNKERVQTFDFRPLLNAGAH